MHKILFLIFLFSNFLFFNSFGQNKEPESAITLEAKYNGDVATNLHGGISQGTVFLGNIEIVVGLDTEKANLWNGGTFFIHGLNNHGKSISALIGDFQGVNNIEATSNTRLYEFWYKHQIGNVSLLIGQHDLNSEFANTGSGAIFINSSFGIQPDISLNADTSIFPVATLGALVQWDFYSNFAILAGIYNGNPGDEMSNPHSLNWKISKIDGAMTIMEIHYSPKTRLQGKYKLGFWNHSADSTINNKLYKNKFGFYFIADKDIIKGSNDSNKRLSSFIQIGVSPTGHSTITNYFGAGLNYKGLLPKRTNDILGLAIAHGNFNKNLDFNNDDSFKNETAIELTYFLPLNENISIQPDMQYVINPGTDHSVNNALTSMLRMTLEF